MHKMIADNNNEIKSEKPYESFLLIASVEYQ